MYQSFDVLKLRMDLNELAEKSSYRKIEADTGGALNKSKISRLVNKKSVFGLRDFEVVVNLLGKTFEDYTFNHML